MTFADLKVTRQYLDALDAMGISEPTEIQRKAIPRIRAGQDVIGIAQTGTGKTLAFLLPVMAMLSHAQGKGPRCVILTPSKELALQIADVAGRLAARTDLRVQVVYGGVGHRAQQERLEAGCDLVVATPGRFMELYLRHGFTTKEMTHLVLDEADRMMDLGFMPQLRKLLEILPRKRQNLLFSATYPAKTEEMAGEFLLWPTRVEAAPQSTPVETVVQSGFRAPQFWHQAEPPGCVPQQGGHPPTGPALCQGKRPSRAHRTADSRGRHACCAHTACQQRAKQPHPRHGAVQGR